MPSPTSARGFTLLETLVATGILITALAGVAQLFALGTHLTKHAGASGFALVAAQDKLESLRGLTFSYGAIGESHTAPALQPSPPSSLSEDLPPYVDWLDSDGDPQSTSEGAALVRRWRVFALPGGAPDAIAIEVCVFQATPPPVEDHSQALTCLSTVRTRQP